MQRERTAYENKRVTMEGINVTISISAHDTGLPLPHPNTLQEMKVATSLYDQIQREEEAKGGGALVW